MGKEQPITPPNRTKLVIKKLLKKLGGGFFLFAVRQKIKKQHFSQLKSSQKGWLVQTKIKNLLKRKIKPFYKFKIEYKNSSKPPRREFSFFSLRRSSELPRQEKGKSHSRGSSELLSRSTTQPTTALNGWGISLQLPRLKLPKPKLPKLPKRKFKLPKPKFAPSLRFVAISFVIATSGYGGWHYLIKDLPHPRQLTQRPQHVTSKILARDGTVFFKIYEEENRTPVALEDIPQNLINATIAIEDKSFYHHLGFSPRGIIRAAIANSQGRTIEQGGSTITQQLVKNRLLNPEKTIQRKLREVILAIATETKYSKDEILEMYFNQVAYGGAVYGVEEAAQRYFGKKASQLNLAESAVLAGLPVAPSIYSPFGPEPALNQDRQAEVLRRMVEDGYISPKQAKQAKQQKLNFAQDAFAIKAPHFVMYVKQLLAQQYGSAMVAQGGLTVTTTLDWPLQQAAQKLVTQEIENLTALRVGNGAALVTDPQTGAILAMVGSKNYFDFEHDGQVNLTISQRQPGSSIKPLTYALALENGQTPSTIIDDSPITYHTPGSKPYSPVNYDGRFHGRVTLREALASSYNVPAVKTLAKIGVETMLDQAELMGIETWQDRSRFGLSLTLGGGEIRMTEMAEMYSAFANGGFNTNLNPILEVENYRGETLYRNTCVLEGRGCTQTKSLSANTAYQITNILSDNQARTPAFGPRSVLHIPNQEVAVKTGTTNNLRDNWAIGYTTDRLVATWVGNNDNSPMSYVASGVTGASPLWNKIMRLQLDPNQPHRFPQPENLIKVRICAPTGTLPCQGCPVIREELFKPGTEPVRACNPKWFEKDEKEKYSEATKVP